MALYNVTALVSMNRITISLIFLIVISSILPASAIMCASGARTTTTTDDNNACTGSSSGDGSTANKNAGNTVDFANIILGIHNRESAVVGVPPLSWSNTLAVNAQTWAQHMATINQMIHSDDFSYGENIAGTSHGNSPPGNLDTLTKMVDLGCRKEYLAGRRIDRGKCGFGRSSHADGVEGHETDRLWCGGSHCR